MLKVLAVLPMGDKTAVTFEGPCLDIKNGSKLVDKNGNEIIIVSVGMTHFNNPDDFGKSTTVLIDGLSPNVGSELSIA